MLPQYQQNIVDALVMSMDYAKSKLGIPSLENRVTIYAFGDFEKLVETYAQKKNISIDTARNHWGNGQGIAESDLGYAFVNTTSDWWKNASDTERMKVVIHEYLHTIQHDSSNKSVGGAVDVVPGAGPRWLSEGIAEFLAYLPLVDNGIISYNEIRNHWIGRMIWSDTSLDTMETWNGFAANLVNTGFSALASEFLATKAGVPALITYYQNLKPNTPWQTTFNQTFGISPKEFYQQFETHQQAGFPNLMSQ